MNTDEQHLKPLLSATLAASKAIDSNGQLRSALRRARTAQDAIGLEEVDRFAQKLEKIREYSHLVRADTGVAEACMVLIAQRNVQRIKAKDQEQEQEPPQWKTWVAVRLGEKSGEQRLLSELRFQRLLRATDGEDRLQQMRRAIALLKVKPHPLAVVQAYLDLHSDRGRRQFAHAYFRPPQAEIPGDAPASAI